MLDIGLSLLKRYSTGALDLSWLMIPATLYIALCVFGSSRMPAWVVSRRTRLVLLGIVCAGACAFAWSLIWVSDDAYISFRYARNLVRGDGLVFNPGQRVEGYTNFLWTLLVAGAMAVGLDPGHAAVLASLASFILLLVLLARLGERLVPKPVLPIGPAPLLTGISYTVVSFATGGLETVFAAMLVVLALDRAVAGKPLAAGFAGIAATLSHPDHGIFYAALGGALLLDRTRRREILRYAVPFVGIFLPYFAWRWSYYGDPLPNTYYTKSAGLAYFDQGGIYLLTTALGGGLFVVLPLVIYGIWCHRQRVAGRFALIGIPLFMLYVAKVGGDFMLGRILTPAIVLCFLFADVGFRALLLRGRGRSAGALLLVAFAGALPVRLLAPGEIFHGIADERSFTPVIDFRAMTVNANGYRVGHLLARAFTERGYEPKIALFSLGMTAYFSDLPAFDLRGLTSPSVAKLPVENRGRPGHEKLASPGDVVASGSVLSEMPVFPRPYDRLGAFRWRVHSLHWVRYERDRVESLGRATRGIRFPRHIDRSLRKLRRTEPARLACDLWHMEAYYFSSNRDPRRQKAVRRAAVEADPSLQGVLPLLLAPSDLGARGFSQIRAFDFESGTEDWTKSGPSRTWGFEAVRPRQGLAYGSRGKLLNTYVERGGRRSTGELRSSPFVIEGDVITLRVGGSFAPGKVTVELEVDGSVERTATGCGTDWMGLRRWDVRPFRGQSARIVVADRSRRDYLLVDEIVEWRAP